MCCDVIRIPALKDNYIWLLRKGSAAVVVDPGDARPVLEILAKEELSLSAILVTHHHADHQGGVPLLLEHHAADVYGPCAESITACTHPLRGGERIDLQALGVAFKVLSVPGHTRGHLAYYTEGMLFCGDTLFGAGCGRLFEGTPGQMVDSLQILAALPDSTAVYSAHEYTQVNLAFARTIEPGNTALQKRSVSVAAARAAGQATMPSVLSLEKATNPFLRCSSPEIVATVVSRQGGPRDPVAVFTALREWRNHF